VLPFDTSDRRNTNSEGLDQEDNPESTYVYTYMGSFINESQPPPIACFGEPVSAVGTARGTGSELVGELTSTDHNGSNLALTSFSSENTIAAKDEVLSMARKELEAQTVSFSVPSSEETAESPTGPMWSVTQTIRNEDMLTIFDTRAVKNAVTRHTITAVGCKWSEKGNISFVNVGNVPRISCQDRQSQIQNEGVRVGESTLPIFAWDDVSSRNWM
jgi:hypothetical protein